MVDLERAVSGLGGRRVVSALGGLYVVLAAGWVFVEDAPLTTEAVIFALIAGPGLVLVYGAYRLPRSDVHPEFYATVAAWSLGGLGVMAVVLGFYSLQPDERVDDPSTILILTGLGSVAGFAAGIHDARARTRARELEETVAKLRVSNERLEQFAYAASHDLQEPLRMVTSYLQLIERRYADELDEAGEEFIDFAVDGADRMRDMIDGLLAYSRVETQGEPFEPVDLEAVLDDAREDLRVRIAESDAEITADALPRVEGDPDQLRQVFQNLLDNAIEYSGDAPPRVHVSAEHNGTGWTISVRDEGIGIDPADQALIFEVFQRLHGREDYDGTGIGLALCKRIVERHDGDLWVDSTPGEGATFSFTLPAVDEHPGWT